MARDTSLHLTKAIGSMGMALLRLIEDLCGSLKIEGLFQRRQLLPWVALEAGLPGGVVSDAEAGPVVLVQLAPAQWDRDGSAGAGAWGKRRNGC